MPARSRRKSFGGRDFGGADVRDERDGGRLRVRRRAAGRGRGCASMSTAGWCSAARRWRRATAIRCEPDPFAEPGWFRTDDVGAVDDSGVLRVLGRVDDAISTGGLDGVAATGRGGVGTHPRSPTARCSASPTSGWASGSSRRSWWPTAVPHPRWPSCAPTSRQRCLDGRAARGAHRRRAAATRHRQGGQARTRRALRLARAASAASWPIGHSDQSPLISTGSPHLLQVSKLLARQHLPCRAPPTTETSAASRRGC